MEVQRRIRKNKIINDIRDANIFINRSEETIKRIKNSQMGETYIKAQIVKFKNAIEEKQKLLEQLNKDIHAVSLGHLDYEIEQEKKNNQTRLKYIRKEKDKASAIKKEEKDEKKEVFQNYWKGILNASRNYRQTERDVKYAYKHYNKVIDSLPSYIKKNLADMPNNKGYIWRNVHFYGELPEDSKTRVMFEKKRGGILIIHEHTDSDYKIYEKEGKNRKKLIHNSKRKVIKSQSSLMDYLKK